MLHRWLADCGALATVQYSFGIIQLWFPHRDWRLDSWSCIGYIIRVISSPAQQGKVLSNKAAALYKHQQLNHLIPKCKMLILHLYLLTVSDCVTHSPTAECVVFDVGQSLP